MAKKLVTVDLEKLDLDDVINGQSFDGVIKIMETLKSRYAGRDVWFETHSWYDGETELILMESREETDKEYKQRIKKEQKHLDSLRKIKSKKEEKDRKEYERLKKKFG